MMDQEFDVLVARLEQGRRKALVIHVKGDTRKFGKLFRKVPNARILSPYEENSFLVCVLPM